MNFKTLCKALEQKIQDSYTNGTSLEEAEKLAAEFLYAQMITSGELTKADLDARMKKTGVKTIRSAIYLDIVQKGDKRPTEAHIAALVDSNDLVANEQTSFDTAEVSRNELERYYDIFVNAHIYYRGVAKGSFGG